MIYEGASCFLKCQFGSGLIIVWAAFDTCGSSPIISMNNKMNLFMYRDMLLGNFLSIVFYLLCITLGLGHFIRTTLLFMFRRQLYILVGSESGETPSMSNSEPQSECNRKTLKILSRNVYKNGRKSNSELDLINAIKNYWNNIDINTLCGLID